MFKLTCQPRFRRPAEREGFEPSNEVDPRYAISSRARSTAPAPLQVERGRRVSLDLPAPRDEDGHPLALARHPGDGDLGAPDHEVDVDLAGVRTTAIRLVLECE